MEPQDVVSASGYRSQSPPAASQRALATICDGRDARDTDRLRKADVDRFAGGLPKSLRVALRGTGKTRASREGSEI
eukprot:scaffold362440_cov32-Prasinocladus_malaysianus.AAC.2